MILRAKFSVRHMIATALLVTGAGCLGVYGGSLAYSKAFQLYESWRFDQARAAEQAVAEKSPLPIVSSGREIRPVSVPAVKPRPVEKASRPLSVIGRVEVPRLHLSAMVEEGTDEGTLGRAVGHVPGTALPGAAGNVAIAGHRDSFFRALKDLRRNDEINFETLDGSFRYTVEEMSVVGPSDTSVLKPTEDKTLTIVTCFPFNYIGPAPRRFIVRARQVGDSSKCSPGARKSEASRAGNSPPE